MDLSFGVNGELCGPLYFYVLLYLFCNSGVETGPGATGSGYNGEQYSPSNLNVKDK